MSRSKSGGPPDPKQSLWDEAVAAEQKLLAREAFELEKSGSRPLLVEHMTGIRWQTPKGEYRVSIVFTPTGSIL